ncbi:hypothetical protein KAU55_02615 [Candidatus Bathyarchaeota archaeon]|nr:hypothetical protein [Candidatus Bathyarchaeota archaeon]
MDDKVGSGIMFGMGMTLVLLGFFGWFHTNFLLRTLSYVFEIDASHYIITDLDKIMRIYNGFLVTGLMFLLFGSLGIKTKVKSDTINLGISLVLGSTLAFLGLINWVEMSFYMMGLMFVLMSVSHTKYKTHAKYYVPTILICGVIVIILGLNLAYATHHYLMYTTGLGVLGGGVINLFIALQEENKKGKRNRNEESL